MGYPRRVKFILSAFIIVFLANMYAFMFIEKLSFIDSLYLIIVTISTVGYGDFRPTFVITKILDILLIVTGISTIALLSESIADKLIRSANTNLSLDHKLEYKNHIVIYGFDAVAERVASIHTQRGYKVIIFDEDEADVLKSIDLGFESYMEVLSIPKNIKLANIKEASGLYLFIENENQLVQTSLIAKAHNPKLLVYAVTDHNLSIDVGKSLGINRTYHLERLVSSSLLVGLRTIKAFSFPNQQLNPRSQFRVIQFHKSFDYKKEFTDFLELGIAMRDLTGFEEFSTKKRFEQLLEQNYGVIAVASEELQRFYERNGISDEKFILSEEEAEVSTLIITGYSREAQHIFEEIDPRLLQGVKTVAVAFSDEEYERAQQDDLQVVRSNRGGIGNTLAELTKDEKVFIVNFSDKITDSLLITQAVTKLGKDTQLLQVARSTVEIELFRESGADIILMPNLLMTRGLSLIFLAERKETLSIVFGNKHIFEEVIDENSRFVDLTVRGIEKQNYRVLAVKPQNESPTRRINNYRLKAGDSIYLSCSQEFLSF